jgi:hypothetical protein
MSLTPARVHTIRTVPKPDRTYATEYRVTTGCVRDARVGITWADHPTPSDTAPRTNNHGNWGDLSNAHNGEAPRG